MVVRTARADAVHERLHPFILYVAVIDAVHGLDPECVRVQAQLLQRQHPHQCELLWHQAEPARTELQNTQLGDVQQGGQAVISAGGEADRQTQFP